MPAKRLACLQCLRPQTACICQWIVPVEHAVEVLILQHPLETDNAKGSARLLHLSLPHSRMVVGEVFAERELRELLFGPRCRQPGEETRPMHVILLYPDPPAGQADMPQPPRLDEVLLQEPAQLRLVVLDGTWRKSRKMLYLNPLLQTLPRLPLRGVPVSQYLIRKAHGPGQLSTLEAACYALMQLERNDEKYARLLNAFNGFVAHFAARYCQLNASSRIS